MTDDSTTNRTAEVVEKLTRVLNAGQSGDNLFTENDVRKALHHGARPATAPAKKSAAAKSKK